jgi:hypothetical protein
LCCLSFYLPFLINPLISSNFSYISDNIHVKTIGRAFGNGNTNCRENNFEGTKGVDKISLIEVGKTIEWQKEKKNWSTKHYTVNSSAPGNIPVSAPLVALVLLLINDTNIVLNGNHVGRST